MLQRRSARVKALIEARFLTIIWKLRYVSPGAEREFRMDAVFAYIPCSDHAEAENIGRAILGERLAACVNIYDTMHSIYHWQGALEESREAVLIIKTRKALAEQLIGRVRELHSYSVACILIFPALTGNSEYLEWLERETADGGASGQKE
jgi:periplasmic divalent cation tolerance protein